ncbi:FecR family protein [Gammaproteobacteria bacterium]|nr:FecR family protein [Gammaproteobacteria bacterium]
MKMLLLISLLCYSIISIADKVAVPQKEKPEIKTIGQVIWTKGKVDAFLPEKDRRKLSRRGSIYEKDTIESNKNSKAQINFTDGTLLLVSENTKIEIEKYNYNKKDSKQDSYIMSLAKGGLRTVTGEIAKKNPDGYKAKTPIATLSQIGTDYSIINKNNKKMLFAVKKGKILVTNKDGQTFKLGEGFDNKYATVDFATSKIELLNKIPPELKTLESLKFKKINVNKSGVKGRSGGGFCVY